jgi:cyanoexosortase A
MDKAECPSLEGGTVSWKAAVTGLWSGKLTASPSVAALGCLALVLIAIHLSLLHRINTAGQLGISILTWPVVVFLFAGRWRAIQSLGSVAGGICGALVLTIVLSHSFFANSRDQTFPHLYPLLAGMGVILLVGGFRGLPLCWRELTLLLCLSVTRILLFSLDALPLVVAKIAGFLIWYLGQEVEILGPILILARGAVRVDQGCAGPGVMSYLFCMAVMVVLLFRLRPSQRLLVLLAAPAIAFVTNVVRIVVVALLEGSGRHDAFAFWHGGPGSSLWDAMPVLIFGMVLFSLSGSVRRTSLREEQA